MISFGRTRRRIVLFFGTGALLWMLFLYNVAGVPERIASWSVLRNVLFLRSHAAGLFCVCVLAAFGLDALWSRATRMRSGRAGRAIRTRSAVGFVIVAVGVGIAAYALAWYSRHIYHAPEGQAHVAARLARAKILFVFATGAVGVGAVAASAWLRRRALWCACAVAALAVVFLQGGYLQRDWNTVASRAFVYPHTPALQAAQRAVGDRQAMFVGAAGIPPDLNLWYRIHTPDNYDVIDVDAYARLYRRALRPPPPYQSGGALLEVLMGPVRPRGVGALRALGIQSVVSYPTMPPPVAGLGPARTVGAIAVRDVPGSPPRFYSPASVRAVPTQDAALRQVTADDFAPLDTSVVEGDGAVRSGTDAGRPPAGTVRVLSETPTATHLAVSRSTPGWVIGLQTKMPGWRATVDGRTVAVHRANAAFLAVPVPAGTHAVVFRYRPTSVIVGAWSSVLALLVVVGLFGSAVTRPRYAGRRRSHGSGASGSDALTRS